MLREVLKWEIFMSKFLSNNIVILICAFFLSVPIVRPWNLDTDSVDASLVRYGDVTTFVEAEAKKIGVIDSKKIYDAIPEYKKIAAESIKEGTAQWTLLMKAATEKYKAALKKAAVDNSYVLIVEIGGVSDYPHTEDATEKIVALI